MLKSIRLVNFFSFKDETIELNPEVNILVGINGSGKSNFLKALEFLNKGLVGNENALKDLILKRWGGINEIFYAGENVGEIIELDFVINHTKLNQINAFHFNGDPHYNIKISKKASSANYVLSESLTADNGYEYYNSYGGFAYVSVRQADKNQRTKYEYDDEQELFLKDARFNDNKKFYPIYTIRRALIELIVYNQFDTTLDGPIRKPSLILESKRLESQGSNLVQLLNSFQHNKTKIFNKLSFSLNSVNHFFKNIGFSILGSNSIELTLQESDLNKTIHISKISDGTLRYICLMSILLNPDRGNTVGIDEPELGLHPDMINQISEAIEEAGKSSQLLISTHEYRILNHFNINQILVFEKNEQNATKVFNYNEEQFAGWYEKYMPGEMWRNGDLGGNRW